ncbi:MAG: hypothetical protein Q8Q42_01810 [Nanoarchaeota archaeon]|nr:hypothetical protein [Nanoarchaeota archaeon]
MKLGEALSKLKKEKSKLARLISLRKENVYTDGNKKTAFDPNELSQEINKKIKEIRNLKIKIQTTNLKINVFEESMSMTEAIIEVNDIRNEISNLSALFERKREWLLRDSDDKKVAQLDEKSIEKEIENLEEKKVQLDNKIQITNWTTQFDE